MKARLLSLAAAGLVAAVSLAAPPPQAPQAGAASGGTGHGGLREALERNEIVPFKTILDWIDRNYVGKVVEVELEDERDRLRYEIELLTEDGGVIEFEFDARSGELLFVRGQDVESARRK